MDNTQTDTEVKLIFAINELRSKNSKLEKKIDNLTKKIEELDLKFKMKGMQY